MTGRQLRPNEVAGTGDVDALHAIMRDRLGDNWADIFTPVSPPVVVRRPDLAADPVKAYRLIDSPYRPDRSIITPSRWRTTMQMQGIVPWGGLRLTAGEGVAETYVNGHLLRAHQEFIRRCEEEAERLQPDETLCAHGYEVLSEAWDDLSLTLTVRVRTHVVHVNVPCVVPDGSTRTRYGPPW